MRENIKSSRDQPRGDMVFSIRTELLAHATNRNTNLNINTLLKVERLLIYLEGKGKSENTRIAAEKNLKLISQRADLDNPKEVELAIASYKCANSQPASNAYKAKLCDAYQH